MESGTVIIHVRFAPNGAVVEISERPATVSLQDWFNCLSASAGGTYQTFAGGRGVFRLTRSQIDALKDESASSAA